MLLTDWLKCLSGTHSKSCAPLRTVRRQRARAVCVAEMSSQSEALENRTLLSAANILLTDVAGATGFQIIGAFPGGTNFGSSIKPAGDVNGDGFEDVIVGAYYENISAGAAYVLFGKSNGFSPPRDVDNLSATDGFAIRGVNGAKAGSPDYAGNAVSGAGDVNGDGFDDLLVATARYSETANGSNGYVIFGKANNTEVNLSRIDGTRLFASINSTVTTLDVLDSSVLEGMTPFEIQVGSERMTVTAIDSAETTLSGSGVDNFPSTVMLEVSDASVFAGISTPFNVQVGSELMTVSNVDAVTNELTVTRGVNGTIQSHDVATAIAVDRLTVIRGINSTATVHDANSEITEAAVNDSLGFRLTGFGSTPDFNAADATATGGDINGDGYDDIVFGGPRTNVGASYGVGAAYVVFGKENGFANLNISDLNGSNGFRFTDSQAVGDASNQAYIGGAVSIGGDINGDGFDDLVVGAPRFNAVDYGETPGDDGKVFVIFGRTSFSATVEVNSLNGTTGFTATGVINEEARTGVSVSSGGDVNGDGIDDFVIGASGGYDYAHVEGRVYVVFGKTNLGSSGSLNLTQISGTSGFILNGAANYDVAGTSVSVTGDINGDGFDDIVIGAPTINSMSVDPGATNGQVYVVFGGRNVSTTAPGNLSSLNGTTGFKLSGSGSYHAGQRVTSGVDLNGDGFDDIFIGEPYSTPGTVTVFFGTDFGLNNGVGGDGELGNGLQKINGSAAGTLTADAGSGAADILVGGGGNDTLISDGGSDVLIGGSGDDVLTAKLSNFSNPNVPRFDGGTGVDTLTGDTSFGGASIDLTVIPGNRINNIEVIDLEDAATQTLTLNLSTVLAITGAGPTTASSSPFATNDAHTLVILRDSDDTINGIDAGNGWTQGANQMIDGKTFEVFTKAGATVKIQSAITVDGDINGDNVYDFNDGILIALVKAFFPNSSIEANQGGTSLTATAIKANVNALNGESIFDVNEDAAFDFNDGILIALVKAFFPNSSIEANQGGTSLTATAIKANVNAIPSPPSGRFAPPVRPPEEASESAAPLTPSFLPPPPAPLLVNDESSASDAVQTDDSEGTAQRAGAAESNADQAFITDQIDVSLNLLL